MRVDRKDSKGMWGIPGDGWVMAGIVTLETKECLERDDDTVRNRVICVYSELGDRQSNMIEELNHDAELMGNPQTDEGRGELFGFMLVVTTSFRPKIEFDAVYTGQQ